MKKLILLTLTFCYSIISFSQVGIGTSEPNASSQLEVKADDKGVLLPQVALQSTTDNNTISNGNVVCQDYLHEQNRRSEFIIVKK